MLKTVAADPAMASGARDSPDSLHRITEQVFEEARNDVYYYVLTLGVPAGQAQEITQEAFLRLYVSLKRGDQIENMRAWVFRVAHNVALKTRMREARLYPLDEELDTTRQASRENIELELLDRDRQQRLDQAIAELSPQQRQVLHLRAEGLRYREIGEVLGLGTSTVNEFLRRAITKLRKVLHE